MHYKVTGILFALLYLVLLFIIPSCDMGPGLSYDPKLIENQSSRFVEHQLADGGLGPQEGDMALSSDADSLRRVLILKEELRKVIAPQGIEGDFFAIVDISVVERSANLDIHISTVEQIKANGDINIEKRGNDYRLWLVQEGMEWKVQKAISSAPSSTLIYPEWVYKTTEDILAFDFEDFDTVVAEGEKRVEEEYGIVVE